eukprot:3227119-Rhodomonas_salina.2
MAGRAMSRALWRAKACVRASAGHVTMLSLDGRCGWRVRRAAGARAFGVWRLAYVAAVWRMACGVWFLLCCRVAAAASRWSRAFCGLRRE